MAHLLVRLKIEDYSKWRATFDANDAFRKSSGAVGTPQVFRSGDDPWEVSILMEWDELERARQFTKSDELREAMQQAGVTGPPDIYFLHQV